MSDLTHLTIAEAADLLARREIASVELTEAHLRRIDAHDTHLNSFITITSDHALTQARAADAELTRGVRRGPLHGIPLALKDLYDTAGIRTTAGSTFFADRVPDTDARAVTLLYQAGAVLLGKLNMHEWALGVTNILFSPPAWLTASGLACSLTEIVSVAPGGSPDACEPVG